MSEQKKKRQRIYDLLYAKTKPMFPCLPYTKQRKFVFFLRNNSFEKKGEVEDWKKRRKEGFLTALATVIKTAPQSQKENMLMNWKSTKKTVRIVIKQDSSPDLKPLDYRIYPTPLIGQDMTQGQFLSRV